MEIWQLCNSSGPKQWRSIHFSSIFLPSLSLSHLFWTLVTNNFFFKLSEINLSAQWKRCGSWVLWAIKSRLLDTFAHIQFGSSHSARATYVCLWFSSTVSHPENIDSNHLNSFGSLAICMPVWIESIWMKETCLLSSRFDNEIEINFKLSMDFSALNWIYCVRAASNTFSVHFIRLPLESFWFVDVFVPVELSR